MYLLLIILIHSFAERFMSTRHARQKNVKPVPNLAETYRIGRFPASRLIREGLS
jgi:hypothetical protein